MQENTMSFNHRMLHALHILALPLFILLLDLAAIEALSQLAATLITMILGPDGPDFQDIAYFSKGVIAVPVLLLSGRFLERRPPAEIGFAPRHALRSVALGLLISGATMTMITAIFFLMGWYQIQSVADISVAIGSLGGGLLLSFVIAVYEEVLFRGILFRLLERGLGSWLALFISALTFGWLHIVNPDATW